MYSKLPVQVTHIQPQQNPSTPTDPVGYLGYVIGQSLGTTQPNSPITKSLEGVSILSDSLQKLTVTISSDTFWLNVGGLGLGSILVIISAQGLMKQELLSTIKANL